MLRIVFYLASICTMAAQGAAADKSPEPALIVQIKSLDGLLGDVKYIAKLFDQEDQVEQIDGVIAAWAGDKGLAGTGLDPKKPFLAYALASGGGVDSPFAVMLPVVDEALLLKFLENFQVKPEKDKDGIYSVELPNAPVLLYVRLANGYAYVTANDRDNIASQKLVAPDKLTAADANRLMGLTLRLDLIPDDLKQLILGQVERRMAELKDEAPPGESPEQARMRKAGIDMANQLVKVVLSEARALDFNTAIDRAKDDFAVGLSIDGKPDTMMKLVISAMASGTTKFVPSSDTAFHAGLNVSVPAIFRPLLGTIIDSGMKDAVEREADPTRREIAKKLFSSIVPTLKAGVLDLHLAAGSAAATGKYNVVAGLGVENGLGIENAVKFTVGQIPAADRGNIRLDVAKLDNMNVHQLKLDQLDRAGQRLFGTDASAWAAFAPSAMMLGVGGDGATSFRGLAAGNTAKPAPLLLVEGSVARMTPLADDARARTVADRVFGQAPDGTDRFRVSLEGGPRLELKASVKGLVLKYFKQLEDMKKAG